MKKMISLVLFLTVFAIANSVKARSSDFSSIDVYDARGVHKLIMKTDFSANISVNDGDVLYFKITNGAQFALAIAQLRNHNPKMVTDQVIPDVKSGNTLGYTVLISWKK